MNARQKEKRYKQKYEQLKNAYIPPLFEVRRRVDRVRFSKVYPEKLFIENQFSDILVRNDLIKGLTEQLNDYIEFKTWEDPLMNTVRIDAEIKVVSPSDY